MNPELPVVNAREAKHLRMIITSGLTLLLLGIVAAYIYFGMQLAKQDPVVEPMPLPEISATPDEQKIFEALQTAPQTADEAMVEAVGQALETADKAPTADPEAIRRALE
jgi:hypothetical protein